MTGIVSAAKAFSDPARVRILSALRGGELCVCELCDALQMTQSTLSTHLQVIRRAGLAASRKEGKWNYYRLDPPGRRLLNFLLRVFPPAAGPGSAPRQDAQRLRRRLALRGNGACCVGFGRPRPKSRRINPNQKSSV